MGGVASADIPGSHKWPLKPSTGLTGDINAAHAVLSPDEIAAFDTAVPMELTRGYANIHHSMMMHGSYLNQSDRPRRATVVNVLRDGESAQTGSEQREESCPSRARAAWTRAWRTKSVTRAQQLNWLLLSSPPRIRRCLQA